MLGTSISSRPRHVAAHCTRPGTRKVWAMEQDRVGQVTPLSGVRVGILATKMAARTRRTLSRCSLRARGLLAVMTILTFVGSLAVSAPAATAAGSAQWI